MVKGDDSCLRGRGFESRHWHHGNDIFHIDLMWGFSCLFEKTENKWKNRPGWPIFFKKH